MTQAIPNDPPTIAAGPDAMIDADVDQMYELLTCGLEAWSAYWKACFTARDANDLYRANAELVSQTLTLAGHAAARRQSFYGVVVPTLNEA